MKKVVILDYQLGNLFSVQQACNKIGLNAEISSDSKKIEDCDGVILPGVGAFIEAMDNMEKLDLISPLKDFVDKGKPLFGICLGQQLLFTESEEFGSKKGLDLIPGVIRKFPQSSSATNNRIKVPQIGWNKIKKGMNDWNNTPLRGVPDESYMYFVHSYFVMPENKSNILTTTNYEGVEYCSSSVKGNNIFATQFHPEKSGEIGISIYHNWATQYQLI